MFNTAVEGKGGGLRQMRMGGEREQERRAVLRTACEVEMHRERARGNSKD